MATFTVLDMTCGHCVKSITEAIKAQDSNSILEFDLANKSVVINSNLTDEKVIEVLDDIGFEAKAK